METVTTNCVRVFKDIPIEAQGGTVLVDYVYDYEITIEHEKMCQNGNEARIIISSVNGNMKGTLDSYGLSALIVGATYSFHHTEKRDVLAPKCESGDGTKLKYDFIFKVYERFSVGINPGIGPISIDIGLSLGSDNLLCENSITIEQDCCKCAGR